MSELLRLCGSGNLSLATFQDAIDALGQQLSTQDPLCFHVACSNKKVTLEVVQLLHNIFPDALRLRDGAEYLPIHWLCCNEELDESNSLDILQFMLNIDPTLPREVDGVGSLPIHLAVKYKSTKFGKILIDAYPESLRIESRNTGGSLPIHCACRGERVDVADTIQYMLELDPELINAEDNIGHLPIHWAAIYLYGKTTLIELLLNYDPDAASKKTNDGTRRLPLHLACGSYNPNLSSIQLLYDAYPEAIFTRDVNGNTPLDRAQEDEDKENHHVIDFLQSQLVYAGQARDMTAMTTVDENGWLPLHSALKDDSSLGSIKLLMKANPAAIQVADQNGAYPLHIACEFSSIKVVKYLVELDGDTLDRCNANNNSLLHCACWGGNLGVVKYLLEANMPSVSEKNNDKKFAIHLLLECGASLDRESLEYIETVSQLLLANPEVVRDFMPN